MGTRTLWFGLVLLAALGIGYAWWKGRERNLELERLRARLVQVEAALEETKRSEYDRLLFYAATGQKPPTEVMVLCGPCDRPPNIGLQASADTGRDPVESEFRER